MGEHQPTEGLTPLRTYRLPAINRNIAAGWAARGIVLLLSFVNTRLLLESIGTEGLAAYSIIISLMPWLALLNLGLPITIQNAISRLRENNGDYQTARDQAYGTMILLALALTPVTIVIGWLSHHFLFVNYPFASKGAVIGMLMLIYVTGVCQLLIQVMYAEHEAFWPNIYPALAPIWTLCVLVITRYFTFDNFNLLLLLLGLSNLLIPIHASRHLQISKRVQFDVRIAIQQISASKDQLLFSTLAATTLSIDYLVMSRILTAQNIVTYNITSRLFMVILVIHGVLLATNWTPIADLMHASKKSEARKKLERVLKQGLIIGAGAGLPIFYGADQIAQILTGGKIETIPIELSIAFLFYVLLRIWTDTYAMALQAYGAVSEINKFIPFQALISVAAQYFIGTQYGAVGIVFGMALSFILTASWIIPRKFYRVIEN